jgi:TPP-dependent trihydroxycyclohexane-1,2-dione (THcHDO) dehydratase
VAENDLSEDEKAAVEREKARKADYARLVALIRSAEEARAGALGGDYYGGAWKEWRALAEDYQTALTEHVKTYGVGNRYDTEQEVLRAAKEPEGAAVE